MTDAKVDTKAPEFSLFICGGECSAGGEHVWDDWVSMGTYPNGNSMGESAACSKCGLTRMDYDLLKAE